MSPTINYRLQSGEPVSGVTTIMGAVLNKPALLPWAYTQGLENYDRITRRVLQLCGAYTDVAAIGLINQIKEEIQNFQVGKLYDKRDKAAEAGTLGHRLVECDIRGLPKPQKKDYPTEIWDKAQGGFGSYKDWKSRTKFKLIHSEIPLVSEKYKFGGCLDIGGAVTDLELIDLKTGKGVYPNMFIQLGGYGILWNENHPDNQITGYNILNIHPDASFMHERRTDLSAEMEIFLEVNKIFRKMKERGIRL